MFFLYIFAFPVIIRANSLFNFIRCQLCETVQLEGQVSDCDCDFGSVDSAVKNFFSPILAEITTRYFRVDLERPCPYWQEDGQCAMEGCSVCTCDDAEIPRTWLDQEVPFDSQNDPNSNFDIDYGWIASENSDFKKAIGLDRLNMSASQLGLVRGREYLQYLRDTEDDDVDDWIDMSERKEKAEHGVYVNLLQNPERFTGYSGPSAMRVWRSIQQENCFGGVDDVCLEKRVFFRLMSGLQASISTHIARKYWLPDGTWGPNIPLFVRAVGSHVDRLNNLYFTFLFVLRAVVKSGDLLTDFYYDTGNSTDDRLARDLVQQLVTTILPADVGLGEGPAGFGYREAMEGLVSVTVAKDKDKGYLGLMEGSKEVDGQQLSPDGQTDARSGYGGLGGGGDAALGTPHVSNHLEQCRNGFDESILFQVPGESGGRYWQLLEEKQTLQEQFRLRFRNISRIMDCVTCERCRVWGKLQILGLGTAIKVLLTPEEELAMDAVGAGAGALSRQEVIALINTLHQLAKSVEFAAAAAQMELRDKLDQVRKRVFVGGAFGLMLVLPWAAYRIKMWWYKK